MAQIVLIASHDHTSDYGSAWNRESSARAVKEEGLMLKVSCLLTGVLVAQLLGADLQDEVRESVRE